MSEYTQEEISEAWEVIEALRLKRTSSAWLAYKRIAIDYRLALTRAEQQRDAALKQLGHANYALEFMADGEGDASVIAGQALELMRNPVPEQEGKQ